MNTVDLFGNPTSEVRERQHREQKLRAVQEREELRQRILDVLAAEEDWVGAAWIAGQAGRKQAEIVPVITALVRQEKIVVRHYGERLLVYRLRRRP